MPLILTAIDLKLSSTHTEMSTRKNRLNALSAIIRHSETLYDVTDFVAVGINHILQLAYLTTRNLFLKRLPDDIARGLSSLTSRAIRADSTSTSTTTTTSIMTTNSLPKPPTPKSPNGNRTRPRTRATTWIDAFILWPRVYLLISTTVDHSLAVGRLPSDIALPELVRDIPAMGAGFRLPWTVGSGNVVGLGRRRTEGGFVIGDGDDYCRWKRGTERGIIGMGEEERMDYGDTSGNGNGSEKVVGRDSRREEQEEEQRPSINLDYLDLEYAVQVQEPLGGGDGGVGEDIHPPTENDLTIMEAGGGTHIQEEEEEEEEERSQETIGDFDPDTTLFNALSSELLRVDGVDV